MYSTCIFCHQALGTNGAIAAFPVSTRVAFDGERGRLWAVCRACGRWNLSPLAERWEAIEACERAFRDTRRRVGSGNVALARLDDGTELVRIGRPLRPEFAAWRYGDQFGVRRRNARLAAVSWAGALAGLSGLLVLGPIAAAAALPVVAAAELARRRGAARAPAPHRESARLALVDDAGQRLMEPWHALLQARVRGDVDGGWHLELRTTRMRVAGRSRLALALHQLRGAPAVRAVGVLLAGANAAGASQRQIRDAVGRIEAAGHPERYFTRAEQEARRGGRGYRDLWAMPRGIRLALEMAAHEEAERRALEGELAELERHWREAEEIAAIADSLLVPRGVETRLRELAEDGE